jgi:HD-GYP domain-containing protein (c-di-GMP phosphodiesterase class II)
MILEIEISVLTIGHYVVDIGEQPGSFLLSKPGHIKNQLVINALLNKGIVTLLIDTDKTQGHSAQLVVDSALATQNLNNKSTAKKNTTKKEPTGKPPASSKSIASETPQLETTSSGNTPAISKNAPSEEQFSDENIGDESYLLDEQNGPIILDVKKAKKLFDESKSIQKQLFKDIDNGVALNLAPVKEVTQNTLEAIFKNPDALACVINIRNKDEYLLEHSVSVSILITIFARFIGLDQDTTHQLSIGAFLHDVGKIKIPDKILNKPGKLSEKEFEIMKSHVKHSVKIIKTTSGISELSLSVAALHHEKLDGNGYPLKLTADKISRYGRMITICDIFDALTANRVYKDGYTHIKAFGILRNLAKKNHLDARLVDLFIKCIGIYPIGSLVELGSNRLALVEGKNHNDPIRPKVRAFYDTKKHHYVMTKDIDLSNEEDFILQAVKANDFRLDMNKIIDFLMMEG